MVEGMFISAVMRDKKTNITTFVWSCSLNCVVYYVGEILTGKCKYSYVITEGDVKLLYKYFG